MSTKLLSTNYSELLLVHGLEMQLKQNIVTVLFLTCRCRIPGFANDTYNVQGTLHHNMIQMYIPLSNEDDKKYDQCHVYQIDQSNTVFDENNSHSINASLVKCSSWVYSNDVFDYTFVVKVRSSVFLFLIVTQGA